MFFSFNSKRYDYKYGGQYTPIVGIEFQFQKVRLQALTRTVVSGSQPSFNSKRYDYKRSVKVSNVDTHVVSIPKGTITRHIDLAEKLNRCTFQFQKVRLQAERQLLAQVIADKFQFQKVRLQDRHEVQVHDRYRVSIPKGTITSSSGYSMKSINCVFQFQKVRLQAELVQ